MSADVDLAALVLDWPREDRTDASAWEPPLEVWCEAVKAGGRPGAVIASLPECMPEALADDLIAHGTAPLAGIPDALHAVDAAGSIDVIVPPLVTNQRPSPSATVMVSLDEQEAKASLQRYGVSVPAAEVAMSATEAVDAADRIGYPVVLKALGLDHKTEFDAVRLNLGDWTAVDLAATHLLAVSDRLLVEAMIGDAVGELIVGASVDPAVGLHLILGSGGVLVELTGDSEVLILPCSEDDVRDRLSRLKVNRLLAGYRGRPEGDVEAVIKMVMAIQRFVLDHADKLVEMDINPLIVRPRGKGAVAVDALIRLTDHP